MARAKEDERKFKITLLVTHEVLIGFLNRRLGSR